MHIGFMQLSLICWATCCSSNRSLFYVGNSQKYVQPFPGWIAVTFCAELQVEHFRASSGSFNLNEIRKLCLYLLQMPHSLRAAYSETTLSVIFFHLWLVHLPNEIAEYSSVHFLCKYHHLKESQMLYWVSVCLSVCLSIYPSIHPPVSLPSLEVTKHFLGKSNLHSYGDSFIHNSWAH